MKSLTFALTLAVGASLALHSSDAVSARPHKGHKSQARSRAHPVERKKIYLPADLWVRLRCGLQLPKPAPVEFHPVPMPATEAASVAEAPTPDPDPCDFRPVAPAAPPPARQKPSPMTESPEAPFPPVAAGAAGGPIGPDTEAKAPSKPADGAMIPEEPRPDEGGPSVSDEQLQKQAAIYQRFAQQLEWYREKAAFVRQSLARARPYLYLIIEELEKHRLPLDLALLPILESGYQPRAESPKEASGIWQFISETGKDYGLKQNENFDGRFDIAESTRAAVAFLSHLRQRFNGDLLLALASYNCGEGRVEQAIAANRKAGLPMDFWSLALPEETMAYVPRLLALSEIFGHPEKYNIKLQPIPNRPYLERVKFGHIMPVEHVSRLADLPEASFLNLNPGFIGGTIGVDGPYDLLLPRQNAETLGRNLDFLLHPPQLVTPVFDLKNTYPTLIPASFQASPIPVSGLNGSVDGSAGKPPGAGIQWRLVDGYLAEALNPQPPAARAKGPPMKPEGHPRQASPQGAQDEVHYVHVAAAGENVETIAKYYGVDVKLIRGSNKLKPRKRLEPGQKLAIPLDRAKPVDLLAH